MTSRGYTLHQAMDPASPPAHHMQALLSTSHASSAKHRTAQALLSTGQRKLNLAQRPSTRDPGTATARCHNCVQHTPCAVCITGVTLLAAQSLRCLQQNCYAVCSTVITLFAAELLRCLQHSQYVAGSTCSRAGIDIYIYECL